MNAEGHSDLLEEIIRSIPDRVFWKDLDLVYLGCNDAFARDAGFESPEEIIGKNDSQMVWGAYAEQYWLDDREVIAANRPKMDIEEPITTAGNTPRILLTNKIPLRNEAGDVVGVLGTYTDITDRKRVEERMAEQLDELRRWHELTLGREMRVIELKREVNALLARTGQPPRYPEAAEEEPMGGGATESTDES